MQENNQIQTSKNPQTPLSPSAAHKNLPWLAVVLSLLVLGVIGALAYQNLRLKNQLANNTATPATLTIPTTIPTPDLTANWKTYTNTLAGISFKYPLDTVLKTSEKGLYFVDPSKKFQTNILWNLTPVTGTLEEELKSRDQCPPEVTDGIVPGPVLNSLRCDFTKSHYASVNIWVQNGSNIYKAVIGAINPNEPIPNEDINLLNQILSTFKFIDTTSASDSYTACGCGCCGGTPQIKCLFHSIGDDLDKIIADDQKRKNSPQCGQMLGCSTGIIYKYCD